MLKLMLMLILQLQKCLAVKNVKLCDNQQGFLGDSSKLVANLTVLAHNEPYGVYIFARASSLVYTPSADRGKHDM